MNGGPGGFNGLGNMAQHDGGSGGDMDDEQMMQELMQALKAGQDAESEPDMSPVPGAEQDSGGQSGENQMDPEKLKQLLEMLQGGGMGGSSDMGGSSPAQGGPKY